MIENGEEDDSALAAAECLGAMQTILDAISKLPHLYPQVEQVLFPLLTKLINPDNFGTHQITIEVLTINRIL